MAHQVTLPPPYACGAPEEYTRWRTDQEAAISAVVDNPYPVAGLTLPTGAGKSLIVTTVAALTGWRTAILTATRALQDQYLTHFRSLGLADLRGQANYPCKTLRKLTGRGQCDEGPCRGGVPCQYRWNGCDYDTAVTRAERTRLLVTNYAAWMAQYAYGEGLGQWDLLVLDEAHAAPDAVGDFLSIELSDRQLEDAGLSSRSATFLQAPNPAPQTGDPHTWQEWAKTALGGLEKTVSALALKVKSDGHSITELKNLRQTARAMQRLAAMTPEGWIVSDQPSRTFHAIEVGPSVPRTLLCGAKRVVLTSATLTRKTAALLGFDPSRMLWLDSRSAFPVERRPVIHVQTCRVDHRLTPNGLKLLVARIDQILAKRGDRKGIVHTGSYERARLIYESSEHQDRLLIHTDRFGLRNAVERFKWAQPGTVLVSPSVTTGYDFPFRQCEYQIVVKIPWPDSRIPIVKARTAHDPEYPAYLAMQDLVQAVGRGMRSAEDQCETFVLDDHVRWFLFQYRHLAPRWFLDAYRSQLIVPDPPPPL